jgi:hypothetical protein
MYEEKVLLIRKELKANFIVLIIRKKSDCDTLKNVTRSLVSRFRRHLHLYVLTLYYLSENEFRYYNQDDATTPRLH